MTPTSREEWEALTPTALDDFSDLQLKKALQEHFGLKSHVYFMPVAKKREYILNEDARPTIQAEASARQREHQAAGAAHKGKKTVKELIAERSEDREYEFVGVDRPQGGFTDPFNDRRGSVAYVVRDVGDGEEFPTQKQTAKALTELGRLSGFDERITAKKQKPAHKAGFSTLEDVIAGGDPAVQEAAAVITEPIPEPTPDATPLPSDRESALDDILNSIPQ
jgi:hypothetical protein